MFFYWVYLLSDRDQYQYRNQYCFCLTEMDWFVIYYYTKGTLIFLNDNITLNSLLSAHICCFASLSSDFICFKIALHKVDYYANSRTLH